MCKCQCFPIKVKRDFTDAKLPVRSNPDDSGLDVFAYRFDRLYTETKAVETPMTISTILLKPLDRVLVNTGISATVGRGFEIQVRPRSGNALKRGLSVLNTPGTIDASYRGSIGVIIVNLGCDIQEVSVGEKIAQLVVCPVILSEVLEVNDLDETKRGACGFGSTGV